MATKILSYFDGIHWRILKAPHEYFHRSVSGPTNWNVGIPPSLTQENVQTMFDQLPESESLLSVTDLKYKQTYRIGSSNIQCFQFATIEDDPFLVYIPPETLRSLQQEFPDKTKIPELRIAQIVVKYALENGIPEIEVSLEGPIWNMLRHQLRKTSR